MAGNVARLPDGRWRAHYRDAKGKEDARHFDRKLDATRWLASIEVARSPGEWIDPALARVKVGEWAGVWLAGQAQLKPSTLARYELAVARHILPAWENVRLSDMSYADVCQWVAELPDLGLAPSTVRYSHRVLSLMLTHGVRDGRVARNPAEGVKLPRITRAEPMFIDHGQVVELAEAAEPYGLLIRFLAYTGLRWGEMSALRVRNIDLLRRRMRITAAFVEVKGKLVEGAPKTHQVRTVPLPRFLVDELAAHVAGKAPDELVFATPAGAPLRNTNFGRPALGQGGHGCRPRRAHAARPPPHRRQPRRGRRGEREGGTADARPRLGHHDAGRVRRPVRGRPRHGRGPAR